MGVRRLGGVVAISMAWGVSLGARAEGFDGVYIGADAGYASSSARQEVSATALATTATVSVDQNLSGPQVGVFAGFGRVIGKAWYLGGEVNYAYGRQSGESEVSVSGLVSGTIGRKVSISHEAGASVRAGYLVTPGTMFYAQPGFQLAMVEWSNTGMDTSEHSDAAGGFRLGAGVETFVTKHFSWRADLSHTWYGKVYGGDGGVNSGITLSETLARIGVSCHF